MGKAFVRHRRRGALMSAFLLAVLIGAVATPGYSQAATLLNNGKDIISYGSYTYFINNASDYTRVYRVKTSTGGSRKLLATGAVSSCGLHLTRGRIYYQKAGYIYSTALARKNQKKLVKGIIMGAGGQWLYYDNNRGSLYAYNLKTGKKKRLIQGASYLECGGSSGRRLVVTAVDESGNGHVYLINMTKCTKKLVATEYPSDEYQKSSYVVKSCIRNGYLYYAVGELQGTEQGFYGSIKRVKLNGTGRKTLATDVTSSDFSVVKGYVYYVGYKVMRVKTSGGKKHAVSSSSVRVLGSYAYGKSVSGGRFRIARYALGSKLTHKKTVVNIKAPASGDYIIDDMEIVGTRVYIEIQKRVFTANSGWRGELAKEHTYQIPTSRTGLKRLI